MDKKKKSAKSRKGIQKETLLKAYFDYWRIQNNPEYVEFWRRVKEKGDAIHTEYVFEPPMKKDETYQKWFMRTEARGKGKKEAWLVKEMKRFGVWIPLPDPFKKIDWEGLFGSPDQEIIRSMNQAYAHNKKSPFVVKIDLFKDKKENLENVSRQIDFLRTFTGIGPQSREHVEKLISCARVWDLRTGQPKMKFSEIARMMGTNTDATKKRFYRAFEVIFGIHYDPELFRKLKDSVPKESLEKTCNDCRLRKTCITPCPDILPYLNQDFKKLGWREIQMSDKIRKIL